MAMHILISHTPINDQKSGFAVQCWQWFPLDQSGAKTSCTRVDLDGSMIRNGAQSIPMVLGLLASIRQCLNVTKKIRWPSDALEAQLVSKKTFTASQSATNLLRRNPIKHGPVSE